MKTVRVTDEDEVQVVERRERHFSVSYSSLNHFVCIYTVVCESEGGIAHIGEVCDPLPVTLICCLLVNIL